MRIVHKGQILLDAQHVVVIVARQLQRAGFSNVRPLVGGLTAWEAAGLGVEADTQPVVDARL